MRRTLKDMREERRKNRSQVMEFNRGNHASWNQPNSGEGSSVILSDEDPSSVGGANSPGSGGESSRYDHVHEGSQGVVISSDDPQNVGTSPGVGSTGEASDAGHVHQNNLTSSASTPQNLEAVSSSGSGTAMAPINHKHGLRTTNPTDSGQLAYVNGHLVVKEGSTVVRVATYL